MSDRFAKILQQGKTILRGLKPRGNAIVAQQDRNEKLNYTIDWSGWLGSDTISSVTNAVTGISITGASNTTTTAAFSLESTQSGWLEHRITTAAGNIKELLVFLEIDGAPIVSDYGYRAKL
jgi:hypothetical protein